MTDLKIENVRVKSFEPLVSPATMREELPISSQHSQRVAGYRDTIRNIMSGQDKRLLVIVGPCSIHHHEAGLEYATKLKALADRISNEIFVVMRVYFEKPRTTVGWKGLINDPYLDGSLDIQQGLQLAQKILRDITDLGLPCATEFLDPDCSSISFGSGKLGCYRCANDWSSNPPGNGKRTLDASRI